MKIFSWLLAIALIVITATGAGYIISLHLQMKEVKEEVKKLTPEQVWLATLPVITKEEATWTQQH